MNAQTDQQLLRDYAENRSEAAFAELVRRHIDLVYSAALRMVCDSHQAEDVTQGVFVALAQNARQLTHHPVLSGWLHRTTQNLAANAVRTNVRRQIREQEAAAMNELLSAGSDASWEHIAPHLDAALSELSEPDRDALLLRYFERKSAREMAQTLGISDEAAQKRVSRAVERLREFFTKRSVTVGASGLAVVISANAVQAAPVGLALTISTAAALTGTTLAASATATVTKAIAMTTLQKTLVTGTIAVVAGLGIYEARQAWRLRDEVQTIQQQQALVAGQMQALQREYGNATNRLAVMTEENTQLKSGQKLAELLQLRAEVGTLRRSLSSASASNAPATPLSQLMKMMDDPAMKEVFQQAQVRLIKERYGVLFMELKLSPQETEKFTQLVGELWMKDSEAKAGSTGDRAQILQAAADATREIEGQLQSVLGQARYARFKEFNEEIPARTIVKQLNDQLGDNRLNDDQRAHLLQIVKAEPYELTQGNNLGEMDEVFFGSQDVDKHFQQVAESNQRILEQAASFLNSQQLAALATMQSNTISLQKTQGAALTQKLK